MNVGGALCNQILALWVIGACANVGHAADSNKFLEVPRDELRAVVGNDPRASFRVLFLRHLENNLDIGFFAPHHPALSLRLGDDIKETDHHFVPALVAPTNGNGRIGIKGIVC